MVAMSEKLCRNDARPRSGCRRRSDEFGRYGNSSAASESSVAGNYPNGGVTGDIPNGTTDYIWQGWQTMEERNPFGGSGSTDTPIKQFIWGTYIDECLQINLLYVAGPQSLPAGAYYLLQDLLYRAVALTNSSGDIVEAYDCDAYGNTLVFTAPGTTGNWWGDAAEQSSYGANDIIYCGYRFDPETQNYYVRNRYYSPVLGRWLTRDPIGISGGINLYGYVGGRVGDLKDPTGELVSVGIDFSVEITLGLGGSMAYGYAHDDCGNSAHFFAVSQRVGANIGINVGNVGLLSGCLKDFLATNSVAVDITGAAGPVSGTAVIGGASGSGVQGGLSRGFLLPVGLSLGLDEATVVGTPDLSHKCPCQKQKCAAPAALPPGFPFPPPGLPAPPDNGFW